MLNIAHLWVYHKTHPIKKQFIKYENILFGVNLYYCYSKLKSDYLKAMNSAYVMIVVRNHFCHFVKVITQRKKLFLEKINLLWNSGHLDQKNDVKHNMFRFLIPLTWMILL